MMKENKKNFFQEAKWNLVGLLGKSIIDGLFFGTPIDKVGFEKVRSILDSKRFILAFWHSRLLLVNYLFRGWKGVALVSRSDDGEILARIVRQQGHDTVRGSTKKGGLRALAQQIKLLNEADRPAAVIPDGPQGPRFKVQPGVVVLAQKTGCPILPITYSARKMKVFNSWDRFILPRPFTKCRVVYGNPVHVPTTLDQQTFENYRYALEEELCRITTDADQYFGHQI
jgi:lysophospholipid acyltransferase (LPLAT)-like uncharacterized protein